MSATLTFHLALTGTVDEIVLLDTNENLLKAHVMDISQGISEVSRTVVRAGRAPDLTGSDIVMLGASIRPDNVVSRDDFLTGNLGIVREAAANIAKYCPDAVVINVTAPTDVFNYLFYKFIGGDRRKFIGYNYNDTLRLKWASAQVLGATTDRVDAVVLGEHGDKQVPLYEQIYLDKQKVLLSSEQKQRIAELVNNWFSTYSSLKSGRSAGWTSAIGLERIIAAIVQKGDEPIPCSVIADGEYGQKNTSIGLPVMLGPGGVQKIIEMEISDQSQKLLSEAADKITKMANTCL